MAASVCSGLLGGSAPLRAVYLGLMASKLRWVSALAGPLLPEKVMEAINVRVIRPAARVISGCHPHTRLAGLGMMAGILEIHDLVYMDTILWYDRTCREVRSAAAARLRRRGISCEYNAGEGEDVVYTTLAREVVEEELNKWAGLRDFGLRDFGLWACHACSWHA